MDLAQGLPEEFVLLRRELTRISDRRFAMGMAHPPEAALGLMCGQSSLSAIYRSGGAHPELLYGPGLRRRPRWRPCPGCCGWQRCPGCGRPC